MKRNGWLPGTLFGRNVLLIAGIIILVQIGVTAALVVTSQQPRLAGIARHAIQNAEALRQALDTMDRMEADQYIATLDAAEPTRVVRGAAPEGSSEKARGLAQRLLSRHVTAQLPAGYAVRWQQAPQPRLWLGTPVHGEMTWFGLGTGLFMTDLSTVILAVLAVAGLLAFAGAYMVQRRINRPLRRLIDATAQMAAGQAPRPLAEQGAQELAALARSFNDMVESLARTDRERALMLAGISHDLRTPLTKLRFALEYVGPHCEPEMRALMERNIEAADRIIDQFIDFARYGHDEAECRTDLNTLVSAVVDSFEPLREPIGLDLGEVPFLMLRPTAMQRLIANLLRNALEYAGREIVVRTTEAAQNLVLSVLDRGPGIPPAQIERLKQPFTRMEAARSGPGGSGLGLAIVERVTRLHGGRFDLLAREGGGLEARVTLPIAARAG